MTLVDEDEMPNFKKWTKTLCHIVLTKMVQMVLIRKKEEKNVLNCKALYNPGNKQYVKLNQNLESSQIKYLV